MKKMILILGLILSFNAMADELTCAGDENSTCVWSYDESTHTLTITGTGKMKDYGPATPANNAATAVYHAQRPWDTINLDVKHVIVSGLTSVGNRAFQDMSNLESINFSDTVTSFGRSALYNTKLKNLVLPDSVVSIGITAFKSISQLNTLVIPDTVTDIADNAFQNTPAIVYCTSTELCSGKGSDNVVTYAKDKSGLFALTDENGDILEDVNGNPIYYLSANDMTAQSNACLGGYQTCAEQALHNKALALLEKGTVCQTLDTCQALVNTDYNGDVIKLGGKDYASLTDLLKGNSMPKRIYTIDEANLVAKPTGNTIRIKYR